MKTLLTLLFVVLTANCLAEVPINELPMYGGQREPSVEPDEAASADAAARAWRAFAEGDFTTAMKRFNQAWMFDRGNAQAYWGFGLIMGQRSATADPEKNLRESIRFLEMAQKIAPNNARIIGDLAYSQTVLGQYLKTEAEDPGEASKVFSAAEAHFAQAYQLEKSYPPIPANWSVLKFYTGDYATAKTLLDEAESAGFQADPAYKNALKEKLQ